ncbi:MAG: pilus assembly protein [Maricaulaceae bacterium]|jgi:Flp pilus assembly protein TadG
MHRRLTAFLKSRDGNVAMIFALTIIPFLMLAGMALDVGRTIMVRERLGQAIDAAILAVGAAPELTEDEAQALGEQFFEANYGDDLLGSTFDISVEIQGDVITMSANAEVPTTLLAIAGKSSFNVHQEAEAVRGGNDVELVFVLDNTGSMRGSKIASLRDAATSAVELLFDTATSDRDAVQIGLVPFAATVNVGTDFDRVWWMDEAAASPAHHHEHTWNADINRWDLFDAVNVNWAGCVESRAEPHDIEDTTPSVGDPDTLFTPYFAADAPGSRGRGWGNHYSSYESWLDDGEWTRALDEDEISRGTMRGIRRSVSQALEDVIGEGLDTSLGFGDGEYYDSEEGARQAYIGKYFESTRVYGDGPNQGCIEQPIFPLSDDESGLLDAIDDMEANGNTNIVNGISWGVRVLSPTAPFTEGRSYDDDELVKAMVVLTDGDNVMSGRTNANMSTYNTYGYIAEGRFGITPNGGYNGGNYGAVLSNRLDDKMPEVCDYAKDQGIRVYTITFQVRSAATRRLMEECASTDDGGDPLYWNSPSNNELEQTFMEIARDLVELRLTK